MFQLWTGCGRPGGRPGGQPLCSGRGNPSPAVSSARSGRPGERYAASVMDSSVPPPHPFEPRPRRRDRHGRGMRGPVAPPQVPLSASRGEVFRDLVQDSVERLERRWPQLAEVDFVVLEVPGDLEESVPLGTAVPAAKGRPAQIVVYPAARRDPHQEPRRTRPPGPRGRRRAGRRAAGAGPGVRRPAVRAGLGRRPRAGDAARSPVTPAPAVCRQWLDGARSVVQYRQVLSRRRHHDRAPVVRQRLDREHLDAALGQDQRP